MLKGMSRTPKSLHSQQELLAAAGRVLRERGLHGVRVREVAASAGMSVGAVMYHYPTTEDLLLAVHVDVQQRYLQRRREAVEEAGMEPWAQLLAAFRVGLPQFGDIGLIELLYEMHGLTRRSPRHAVLLTELWEAEISICMSTLEVGAADGTFHAPSPEATARALVALEDGLALHLVSHNDALDSGEALRTYQDAAASLLRYGIDSD